MSKLVKEFLLLSVGLLLVAAMVWGVFGDPELPQSRSNEIHLDFSIEQERALGELLLDWQLERETIVTDQLVVNAVQDITERLITVMDSSSYAHEILVVEDEEVNAFALPGGIIVINTGLILFTDNPSELAAVVAHELGHVEQRHVVERMGAEIGIAVLISIVSGGEPSLLHELAQWLLSNVFSRSQEAKADDFALNLLERAQIDPEAMGNFFTKANELDVFGEGTWISSHPSNEDRIAKSKSYEVSKSFMAKPIMVDWQKVQQRMKEI